MDLLATLPPDLFDARLLAAFAVAMAAGLMRGFAGFGSAMALSPVLAILYGPAEMIVMIILMELIISVQLLPEATRHVQWRFVAPMSLAAAVFMPLGAIILVNVDTGLLTRAIAAIVLAFALLLMTGWRYRGARRLPLTLALGATSGTMMATTSMGGPPVLAYMLSGPDPAAVNRANIIVYYAVTEVFLLAVMLWHGLVTADSIWRVACLTPAYIAITYVGQRLFRQSSERLYRRIALAFLLLVALYGLLR